VRLRAKQPRRKGGTVAEAAIVITLFLVLVMGVIDMGLAIFQRQVLSEAARQGARQAIVHGSKGTTSWGASQYGPASADTDAAIPNAIRPYLVGIDPASVNITVQWLDSSNDDKNRVRVTLEYTYHPMTTLVVQSTIPLSASSTMLIAH
jgi:Flp pilus assembly protein TadG